MTFLEIVFAMTLLGILAATLLGAANFMLARQRHEQRTLAALEIANRLILQFLDDPGGMPDSSAPVGYGDDYYRWTKDESQLSFVPAKLPTTLVEGRTPQNFSKLKVVKLRVWLAPESGGGASSGGSVPHAEISRMYDSAQIFRNPDAMEHLMSTEEGRRRLLESSGASPSTTPQRPASTPAGGGRNSSGGGGSR
jgi:type II secretory pathway pseudopilin PulG